MRELASKFGARVTELSLIPSAPSGGGAGLEEEYKRRLRDTFHQLLRSVAQERSQRADLDLGYAAATVRHRRHHQPHLTSSPHPSTAASSRTQKGSDYTTALDPDDLDPQERERIEGEEQAAGPGPEAISISNFLASISPPAISSSSSASSESEDENKISVKPDPDAAHEAESEDESNDSSSCTTSRRSSVVTSSSTSMSDEHHEEKEDEDAAQMLHNVSIPSMPDQHAGQVYAHANSNAGLPGPLSNPSLFQSSTSIPQSSHFPLASGKKKARAKEAVYVSLADLVDRFYFSVVAQIDPDFVSAVLVFYRAFASPEFLLFELMSRFDVLAQNFKEATEDATAVPAAVPVATEQAPKDPALVRHALVRLVTVFRDWIRQYPGDLSSPTMAKSLSCFAAKVAEHPPTSAMVPGLQRELELCPSAIDLDIMWSVEASTTLLTSPTAWVEVGASESAAARHEAYRHSVLLPALDPVKERPTTTSAREALEALSSSGLSMLSPPPSAGLSTSAPHGASSSSGDVCTAAFANTNSPSKSPASHNPAAAPSPPSSQPARSSLSGTVHSSEPDSRARSASVATISSGQESEVSWQTSASASSVTEPTSFSAAGAAVQPTASSSEQQEEMCDRRSSLRAAEKRAHPRSNTLSSVSTSGGQTSMSTGSGSTSASSLPPLHGGASTLPPHKVTMSLRSVSNALLVVDESELAEEMTRIEWDLFSVIGPRDWLRHALVKPHYRVPHGRVAKSISHFNYISAWVVSVVLAQPKAKTRARAVEKLIRVAVRLRILNNYNTLYAVLSGLASGPIHRLRHTRALVQENRELHKRHLSLTRLMSPDRASAAYRLALENSSGRIIPFIGVHLHDILSTADGNPSRRSTDGAVHWRKFLLMNDAISTLTKAQMADSSPPIEHPRLTQLIVDVPILEEDVRFASSFLFPLCIFLCSSRLLVFRFFGFELMRREGEGGKHFCPAYMAQTNANFLRYTDRIRIVFGLGA